MENVRYNISPCSPGEVAAFINKIDSKTYSPNGRVGATERSHYDRYSYLVGENRIAVVYDTSACILSITGRSDFAKSLLDLFAPSGKSVKSSSVPAQGTPTQKTVVRPISDSSTRAKLFVTPDSIRRRTEFAPVHTLFVTSKGAEISTDEIYPPQTIKRKEVRTEETSAPTIIKRPLTSYGENRLGIPPRDSATGTAKSEKRDDNVGISISLGRRNRTESPKISFGSDDGADDNRDTIKTAARQQEPNVTEKRKRGRPPKKPQPQPQQQSQQQAQQAQVAQQQRPKLQQVQEAPEKRKRGRPPKTQNAQASADIVPTPEYKNGYSVKNFPFEALNAALKRLKSYGKTVATGEIEFAGTIQEVKNYTVSDGDQKVLLRYATKRMTIQLQGKRSNLFGEVMSLIGGCSDYSSALENYVENQNGGKGNVSDVQNKLKKRLPNAFEFLSEQSRIDFSYGIHDFSQNGLHLSDYSVLLVPAFRGLERFIFDLQSAEDIKVKMIGQAFDKNDDGKYILKSGYTRRIGSVIYAEVLVALYSEYFEQRNFFAHSDNTDSNISRAIPERAAAQKIFEHLLDVVEYNAKKLKEIGFSM
ncbi:MAG: type II toxin-antitoxin system RnlA family toxin [Clostridiales bacterium]|nr:type II toxin-antitoxin system RnlA family toxin [Clostridiales bacterium]